MDWLRNSWPQVIDLLIAHVKLAIPALLIAAAIAIPVGYFAAIKPRWGAPLVTVLSLIYTIPALPMLVLIPFIIAVPLRSTANVIIALCLYGVALLVRSATTAFGSVDEQTRLAAQAQGMSGRQLFAQVDLPLATPGLIAGLRVMAVSTIALVTIGALIGVSSLGTLFTDGFQRGIIAEVLTGLVLTVGLALIIDMALQLVNHLITGRYNDQR